ncbi:MAG TPA: HD domain-containing phosphohydrolase, partial [Clostridia bacterium]|nr:HD domain-containing phosphohydrolase [Clostridia bacterium]
ALKLSEADIKKLELAGRFHDIGKVVLDPSLLDKGHEFNPKEQKERDQHPIIGYRILNYFDDTLELAEIVLAHHENWDGSGYPKGLKGEAIPLLARILSIAGAYEQMMHPSTNNEAKSLEEAVLELERELGVLYDPIIGAAFIELLRSA